jgi:FAD linked oxidases, C-terminal domain
MAAAGEGTDSTLTGEHGVGIIKRHWLADELGPESMAVHHAIKNALELVGITGKVLSRRSRRLPRPAGTRNGARRGSPLDCRGKPGTGTPARHAAGNRSFNSRIAWLRNRRSAAGVTPATSAACRSLRSR